MPADNRIKPICRQYPGVEPVQVRKWIRNLAALQSALPTAKLVQKQRTPSPPDLIAYDDSSETESVDSVQQPTSAAQRPRLDLADARDPETTPTASPSRRKAVSSSRSGTALQGGRAAELELDWSEKVRVAHELLNLSSI